jgi:hypothetical protein
MGSASWLGAVGVQYGVVGGDCAPKPSLVGAECEPGDPFVCEPIAHCLQAATPSGALKVLSSRQSGRVAARGYGEKSEK